MPTGLITGWPGWLAHRFLQHLGAPAASAWQEHLRTYAWSVLAAPEVPVAADVPPGPVRTVHRGDVRDPQALAQAVRGVDLVVHAAGLIHPRRIRELYQVNRDGTARLARLAAAAGVRRFAFISSNAAAGFAAGPEAVMREEDVARPESHYGHSKRQAELAVWEAVAGTQTEAVVLRPTTFYGPGFPRRHLRAYAMARSGRPWLIGDGANRVSMVYIDSLVAGVGLSLTSDRAAGQTFFLADARPYPWTEVFQAMGEAQQVQVRPRHLPVGLATTCHVLDLWLARCDRYSMAVHLAGEATRQMACSTDKAAAELGYRPGVELREGMRQAVGWAREAGWL